MKIIILLGFVICSFAFTENMMSLEELSKFDVKSIDCHKKDQISLIENYMR